MANVAAQSASADPEIFVRRLYKPRLSDQVDISGGALTLKDSQRANQLHGGAIGVPQSAFLLQSGFTLPEEFGKIYLGETFSAYVSIVNTLPVVIQIQEAQASLRSSRSTESTLNNLAPVRSGNQTHINGLGITRDRPRELQPGETMDIIIEQMLQELDWHYLAIRMDFFDMRTGETKPLMKRFKFKVYNPISVSVVHKTLPNDEILIQANLKNITEKHTALLLEDVSFIAEEGLYSKTLHPPAQGHEEELGIVPSNEVLFHLMGIAGRPEPSTAMGDCVSAFDHHIYLQPDDVVQHIYRLLPSRSSSPPFTAGQSLGQLKVSWRTTMGEAGTLLSPRVVFSAEAAIPKRQVELQLEKILTPDMQLLQGQMYVAKCALHNHGDRELWLQVQFHLEAMQGIYVTGKSFHNAGALPAHSSKSLAFHILPLMAGLHELKGATVVDLISSQEYPQEKLGEYMVLQREDAKSEGIEDDRIELL